jgi:plasmid stability protein
MTPLDIKLTVRLPERLHAALRRRARATAHSVNREIIDTLLRGLARDEGDRRGERDAVTAVLREHGLWAPGETWGVPAAAQDVTDDHAALRRSIGRIPPLSELVIEGRGPI